MTMETVFNLDFKFYTVQSSQKRHPNLGVKLPTDPIFFLGFGVI